MKRCLALARQFYEDIFAVLNVESLDATKCVFKSIMEEQNVSMQHNDEIKSLMRMIVDAEADKVALEKKFIDAKVKLV